MAKPSVGDRLRHILDAIADIEQQTDGLDLKAFREDRFRRLAIEKVPGDHE